MSRFASCIIKQAVCDQFHVAEIFFRSTVRSLKNSVQTHCCLGHCAGGRNNLLPLRQPLICLGQFAFKPLQLFPLRKQHFQ